MRSLVVLAILVFAAFTAQWFTIDRSGNETSIKINKDEIRGDLTRAFERGREYLDERDSSGGPRLEYEELQRQTANNDRYRQTDPYHSRDPHPSTDSRYSERYADPYQSSRDIRYAPTERPNYGYDNRQPTYTEPRYRNPAPYEYAAPRRDPYAPSYDERYRSSPSYSPTYRAENPYSVPPPTYRQTYDSRSIPRY